MGTNPRQLGNLRLRQSLASQPQRFHVPLDYRVRVVIAFVLELGLNFRGEL